MSRFLVFILHKLEKLSFIYFKLIKYFNLMLDIFTNFDTHYFCFFRQNAIFFITKKIFCCKTMLYIIQHKFLVYWIYFHYLQNFKFKKKIVFHIWILHFTQNLSNASNFVLKSFEEFPMKQYNFDILIACVD